MRELAERTNLSNAYLSQIERGLHTPSVRVLRLVANALELSAETLLGQAGLWDEAGEGEPSSPGAAGRPTATETAIRNDARLSDAQKEALLSVYRSYIAANRP